MGKSSKTRHMDSGSDATEQPTPSRAPRPPGWVVAIILALTLGAVYVPALDVPFIFDDEGTITTNSSVFSLWPLVGTAQHRGPLNAQPARPTGGRPLVNYSFALNYSVGGLDPTGYHVTNLAIHFASALLLFAVVRRTLLLPYFGQRFGRSAGWLAASTALLWSLHPLHTETVIYATQRTELMMALFYLGTFYASFRYWAATTTSRRAMWLVIAVISSLCGMASKEVMVSAPLMILLFERTFIAGSLMKAMRQSWPLYIGLALTLILLLVLNWSTPHSGSAGFGLGVPLVAWWMTQCKVVWMYLRLVVWPWPLLLHYHFPYLSPQEAAWYVVPLAILGIVTFVLLWRNHPVGYLLTFVFAILAPTSVVPIPTEMAAERRMYLALAALAALFVVGGYLVVATMLRRVQHTDPSVPSKSTITIYAVPVLLLAIVFGIVSSRNLVTYDDELKLWEEVIHHQPKDVVAYNRRGTMHLLANRIPESIQDFQTAIEVNPQFWTARNGLALALRTSGRTDEALEQLKLTLQQGRPNFAAYFNYGQTLITMGALDEAIEPLQQAVKLDPESPEAHNFLGMALGARNRFPEAIEQLQIALDLSPNYAGAYNNLGIALSYSGKKQEAMEAFRRAVAIEPDNPNAHLNLAELLAESAAYEEAVPHFLRALELRPGRAEARFSLANTLRKLNRTNEAINQYDGAIRSKHDFFAAYLALSKTLAESGHSREATTVARKGLDVAQRAGNDKETQQLSEWLEHLQADKPTDPESKPSS